MLRKQLENEYGWDPAEHSEKPFEKVTGEEFAKAAMHSCGSTTASQVPAEDCVPRKRNSTRTSLR
ncbi:unnamed protein product, partial [Amoebophrya sp. A25]|eukprot:GSA25T00017638001.1